MRIGTGSILDRKFAGIYRNASGTVAEASSSTGTKQEAIKSLQHEGYLALGYNSDDEPMTPARAQTIIDQLNQLDDKTAMKLLITPISNDISGCSAFLIKALASRLADAPTRDNTSESAKATIGIFNAICDKFQSSQQFLMKMMYVNYSQTGSPNSSAMTNLTHAVTFWLTEPNPDEVIRELLKLINRINSVQ